jgi:pimeloyl-ACP methyl ester carboxylesterase
MNRASLDDVELEYEIRGSGEPVVLVHHGAGADWFQPLMEEPALVGRFRLVRYHRAGYGGSGNLIPPLTFSQEAAHFRLLMRHLRIPRAHVVGHSASGCMALQMAIDAADCVHSLALLEPALMAVPSPPEVPQAMQLYREGEKTTAVATFLRGTCGERSHVVLDSVVPGALDQALADADTFFGHELPALRQWSFGPDEARLITQPVLAVIGEQSDSRFEQRQKILLDWLPNVEPFVLPRAGHLLFLENRSDFGRGVADFLDRHPIGRPH